MPHMAVFPTIGITDHAKTGNVIDHGVFPSGLERCAMAAFMPTRIHRRSVQHTISHPKRNRPPRRHDHNRSACKRCHQRKQHNRIACRGMIGTFHQVLHHLAINRCTIPIFCYQTRCNRLRICRPSQVIVAKGHDLRYPVFRDPCVIWQST